MATFKCPDCKTKVSTEAEKCPKCGRPVTEEDRKPPKKVTWKQRIAGMLIMLCIVAAISMCSAAKDKEHKDEIARLRYTYTTVKVDNRELFAKVQAYVDNTLMPEVRRVCKKSGLPAPKSVRLAWQKTGFDEYKLFVIFEGGTPAQNRVETLSRMLVGKIHSILHDDFKVPEAQFICEDTWISVYMFSDVLGRNIVHGGVYWHVGKKDDLPKWVTPEDAKKFNNL